MSQTRTPEPVASIVAVMAVNRETLSEAKERLRDRFGETAFESEVFPFTYSTYYRQEMGDELLKQFVSFSEPMQREMLPEAKRAARELEKTLGIYESGELRRQANIDPGYLSLSKLVLASTKNYDHRIYLRDGIFAEITLRYRRGRFEPMEWTYPDYRTDLALAFFTLVRDSLLIQHRSSTP